MALDHSCQVQRHPFSERGLDLYETPAVAVETLLRAEKIPIHIGIWEPSAGRGAITRVLRSHGYYTVSSDVADHGGDTLDFVGDFLVQTEMPAGCNAILTNPPFKIVERFFAHALELSPNVVMLLRLAFLESERRCNILEGAGLARVHVFRKRLPMMHRDGWEGKKGNSGMGFMWARWRRGYAGPVVLDRISWER